MNSALIGIGNIASTHIEALRATGHKIVALCDTVIEKVQSANEKYNLNAKIFTDHKEMLESCKIDCVHILTPHYLHKEMIIYALEKNINVLCEKPLCINARELLEIERAVKTSKASLGVCYQNRFRESNKKLFELLNNQEITSAFASVVWQRDKAYYNSANWRGKKAMEGGGVLINQAIHTLDLIIKLCGMPNTVIAHSFNNSLKGVIEVEDTVSTVLKYKDKNAIFFATVSASTDFPVQIMVRTRWHTYAANQDNITIDGEIFEVKSDKNLIKEVWGDGHNKLICNFYDCLENGKPFEVDFYEAAKSIKVIDAIYKSRGKGIAI